MSRSPLSNQRQLVELLDPEPVLAYLLQNGALNQTDVEILKAETSQAKTNLTLLKCLEANGQHAQNLLVNALRQTGQLRLASLLDEGMRIKTFTGSGYLSKKRHRGQLSLRLEIKALKFDQESVFSIINPVTKTAPISREWVSVDDISRRISILSESQTKLSSSVHFVEASDNSSKKRSCLCACFASLFSRKKKASKSDSYISTAGVPDSNGNGVNGINHSPSFGRNGKRGSSPSNHYISRTTTHITSTSNSSKPSLQNSQQDLAHTGNNRYSRTSIENLRNLLDLFHHKADEVCTIMQETNCKTRDSVIKYFEQNRGVLVLDTEIGTDAFVVNNICTQTQQVETLRKDFSCGKLTKDLEVRIVTEEILQRTGLLGIRIKAKLDLDELDLVEQELSS